MPTDRVLWLERIGAVEVEFSAMRLAIDRLSAEARRDVTILGGDLTPRDIAAASERLEGTYIIRLFAEFETGLRLFWSSTRRTSPPGRTRDLLDGIAAPRQIPHGPLTNAHAVREYRNSLVHLRDEPIAPIPIAQARGHLRTFLSYLPPTWGP